MRMKSPLALLINMDGAEARLAHFTQQAERAGLSFERIAGVNGRAMSDSELQAHRDPGAIYPLAAGEIGALLSHRRAWQRIYDTGAAWGCVFEDDACLQPETGALISSLPEDMATPTIISLEASNGEYVAVSKKAIRFCSRDLYELRGVSIGAAAYALNRSACVRLLADEPRYAAAIDLYLFARRYGAIRGIRLLRLDPAPVIQADRLMTIEAAAEVGLASVVPERAKKLRPKLTFGKLLKREIYRMREQAWSIGAQRRTIPWG